MTRTGQSPKLGAHKPEPFVEIHPLDAKAHGLVEQRLRPCPLARTAPARSRS